MPTYTHFDPEHQPQPFSQVFRWAVLDRLTGRRKVAPPGPPAPRVAPDLERLQQRAAEPRVTWIGHASFLGQLGGASVLIDPVFSRALSGVFRRYVAPGLAPEQLPPIDALLISHSHRDHLDEPSVLRLPRSTPVVVPLGLDSWFRRRGFEQVTELGWWDAVEVAGLKVTATPARHWSRRGFMDLNHSLWCGYLLESESGNLYHAGDSGSFPGFREIGARFPDIQVALMPIGAYRPAWFMEPNHMNPEQAAQAFLELGARYLVPMHWGTFQLTDEPISEPIERLRAWWRQHSPAGRHLRELAVGATLDLAAEGSGSG